MNKKNSAIEKVLTSIAGILRQDAEQEKICTLCKAPIKYFRDRLSQKEYQISGMCQHCQDEIFGYIAV